MSVLFVQYPACSTCKKAKKWLTEKDVKFIERDIKMERPTKEELDLWITKSGLDIKKFFNTSGLVYRSLGLKDKLKDMSREEKIQLLASDGMLVKRPLIIGEDVVLVGFKEAEWEEKL
ncbi:MAG TPA: arsenate reductase family protein [Candidatus Merdenecus merdavium]|nr:arsenate reductase family protein [Candidatus Merdenecus merdavium]